MNIEALIGQRLEEHLAQAKALAGKTGEIAAAASLIADTYLAGNKLILAGNGGSAADAQHWAAEWMIRLFPDVQRRALPAIALHAETSSLTAGANDIGFENVYARQIEGLGLPGDLAILISTSGNSVNLLKAADMAHQRGMKVLGILGKGGGKLLQLCDKSVVVESNDTQRIQEMHSFIGHMLCEISEKLFMEGTSA